MLKNHPEAEVVSNILLYFSRIVFDESVFVYKIVEFLEFC